MFQRATKMHCVKKHGVCNLVKTTQNKIDETLNVCERTLPAAVMKAHDDAVAQGKNSYTDPESKFNAFTRLFHIERGRCCGSMCRHCPYGHVNVPPVFMERFLDRESKATFPSPNTLVTTKTGDGGTSALFTGERRLKTDVAFDTLGTIDELSCAIGLGKELLTKDVEEAKRKRIRPELVSIQQWLQSACTVVATPTQSKSGLGASADSRTDRTKELETWIAAYDRELPPLKKFILPGGGVTAAQIHVCRSVCRRTERTVRSLIQERGSEYDAQLVDVAIFFNRLSDYFFMLARFLSTTEEA